MQLRYLILASLLMLAGCSLTPVLPVTPDAYWESKGFKPSDPRPDTEGLACKMLKASVCTYDIETRIHPDGSLPLSSGGNAQADFCPLLPDLLVAQGVARESSDNSSQHRDAGFIALVSDSNERFLPRKTRLPSSTVLIAFRGTMAPGSENLDAVVEDWSNDANAKLVALKTNDPNGIKVHRGFRNALDNIQSNLYKWIEVWRASGKLAESFRVYVTGHSKGGAMAQIAALELHDKGIAVTAVYTFAAARAGDVNFAKRYADTPTWRYENQGDVVAHLPPKPDELSAMRETKARMFLKINAMDSYSSVGTLYYITDAIKIITPGDNDAALSEARLAIFRQSVRAEIDHLSLVRNLAWAHGSGPPQKAGEPSALHRYWRAVCGEQVPQ